jgi:outer membrane protein OmpU
MSGTADNGTTFGAAIDLDENAAGVNQNDAGVAIFISGDLGTLTMGDTDGALDWAMQEVDFAARRRSTTITPRTPASTATAASTVTTTVRSCATTTPSATSPSQSRSSRTTTRRRMGCAVSPLVLASSAAVTVTRSGASVPSTPACSLAAPSASASVTSSPTTAWTTSPAASWRFVIGLSANVALDSGFSAAINYSTIDVGVPGATLLDGTHMAIGAATRSTRSPWRQLRSVRLGSQRISQLTASGYGLSAVYDFGGGLSAHFGYGYSDITCERFRRNARRLFHLVARPEHVLLIHPDQSERRERALCPLFSYQDPGAKLRAKENKNRGRQCQ